MKIRSLILIVAVMLTNSVFGKKKPDPSSNAYLVIGIGATNALTDLGGWSMSMQRNLTLINLRSTRHTTSLGYFYRFKENLKIGLMSHYGNYFMSDVYSNDIKRKNRNLHAKTQLWELSGQIHFQYYNHGVFIWQRARRAYTKRMNLFLRTGFTGMFFDPMAFKNGKWHRLRPLCTEGQGLEGGIQEYSALSCSIPIGFGMEWDFDNIALGIVYELNKTFTDYFDDVSSFYFDSETLAKEKGATASYFSDPSSGENPSWTETGAIRGNPDSDDWYMKLSFTLGFKF